MSWFSLEQGSVSTLALAAAAFGSSLSDRWSVILQKYSIYSNKRLRETPLGPLLIL